VKLLGFFNKNNCLQDVIFFHNLSKENDEMKRVELLGFLHKNTCLPDVNLFS
jgi:hypothetical protein